MKTLKLALLSILCAASVQAQSVLNVLSNETLTLTATPYTAGDCLGQLISFNVPQRGVIMGAAILDGADQGIEADIVLFNRDITTSPGTSTITNNSACGASDADLKKYAIGAIQMGSLNVVDMSGNSMTLKDTSGLPYAADANGKIWAFIKTNSAPTLAAGDLAVRLSVIKAK